MANTLPKYELTEIADRWSSAQVSRQQTLGAVTEMMLDAASVQPGSRVLDVAAGTGDQTLMRLDALARWGTFLPRIFPLAC
jgi:ubiquinone/menaquinone biosynthesis C-methylase UbiE